jgi:hypothetical protein
MSFDPEEFLNSTTTEPNATIYEPIPPAEYQAVIEDIKFQSGVSDKGPWNRLEVLWNIEDEPLRELLGKKKLLSRQSIMLEMLETGGIATGRGKNVGYGRLREAVDLNRPGEPYSPRMLIGRRAKVKVEHEEYKGNVMDKVTAVASLS